MGSRCEHLTPFGQCVYAATGIIEVAETGEEYWVCTMHGGPAA
jgi:hypothetical protein